MMIGVGVEAGLTSGEKLRIVHAVDEVLIAVQVVETAVINSLIEARYRACCLDEGVLCTR